MIGKIDDDDDYKKKCIDDSALIVVIMTTKQYQDKITTTTTTTTTITGDDKSQNWFHYGMRSKGPNRMIALVMDDDDDDDDEEEEEERMNGPRLEWKGRLLTMMHDGGGEGTTMNDARMLWNDDVDDDDDMSGNIIGRLVKEINLKLDSIGITPPSLEGESKCVCVYIILKLIFFII